MQFLENGNSFNCNLCGFNNKTPSDYFAPLGTGGIRGDKYDRPELSKVSNILECRVPMK